MAYQSCWYQTQLPKEMVDILENDIKKYNLEYKDSLLIGNILDEKKRKSKNSWIPTHHWINGLIWYYVDLMNKENFLYDIQGLDGNLQYTKYEEGEFYNWHVDSGLSSHYLPATLDNNATNEEKYVDFLNVKIEKIRKLSVVVQLSDSESYEGGEFQLIDDSGNLYEAPKEKGTIITFDSRAKHRVRKVKKGIRKSIVGWYSGPRWK